MLIVRITSDGIYILLYIHICLIVFVFVSRCGISVYESHTYIY